MTKGCRCSWEAGKPQLHRMRRFPFLDLYLPLLPCKNPERLQIGLYGIRTHVASRVVFLMHSLHFRVSFTTVIYFLLFINFLQFFDYYSSDLLLKILTYNGRQLITFCRSGRIEVTKFFESGSLVLTSSWKGFMLGTRIKTKILMPTALELNYQRTSTCTSICSIIKVKVAELEKTKLKFFRRQRHWA